MDKYFYFDYVMVPDNNGDGESLGVILKFMESLEKLSLMEVRPCFKGRPHNWMNIVVDEVEYDEDLEEFIARFRAK